MYTGPLCNFCEAAKRLFIRNNLLFEEIDISSKDGLKEEMIILLDYLMVKVNECQKWKQLDNQVMKLRR